MKLITLFLLLFSFKQAFTAVAPVCDAIGTRAEGWYLDGQLVRKINGNLAWDSCANKVAKCGAIGTRSEGWFTSTKPKLLAWDNCSNNTSVPPICDRIGSRAEGWYLSGQLVRKIGGGLAWDSCANKIAKCGAVGTRSEGWFTSTQPRLLTWANCSQN